MQAVSQSQATSRGELFSLGNVSFSPAALIAIQETPLCQEDLLRAHHSGKAWQHQPFLKEQNLAALENADWVCSPFKLVTGKTVWLITEPNRATTVALLEAP